MESLVPLRPRGRDRRRGRRFVFGDGRSGFERRRTLRRPPFGAALDSSLVYLRDHRGALVTVLVLANLLSLLDLGFTMIALRLGVVAEANPFMHYFFEASATQAAVVKCGLVAAASLAIWVLRRRRLALKAALLFPTLYGTVVLYEIVGLMWLI